ncbi:DUF6274 family protein [Streptomyces hebeiensis]
MTASTTKHETGALLRAHLVAASGLAAASGHPHRTGACAICHRLQRLAGERRSAEDGIDDGFLEGGFFAGRLTDSR